MKYMTGDLVELAEEGAFDIIMHGCNCFNTMGKGIAPQIKKAFPAAYEADCLTTKGDKKKMGSYSAANVITQYGSSLMVVNAYTQYHFSGQHGFEDDRARRLFSYESFLNVMIKLRSLFPTETIAMPKIGCGLARGSWDVVEYILNHNFAGDNNIIVVEYDK